MAMLAEKRKKIKYCLNPTGNLWNNDNNKLGQKMLEKMGWQKGQGLGASNQGITERLKVPFKFDSSGLGFKEKDGSSQVQNDFQNLLSVLNDESGTNTDQHHSSDLQLQSQPASLEEKSKKSKTRVHYQKFTRGKDISRYSPKDLASIFGKGSQSDPITKIQSDPAVKYKGNLINRGSMNTYFEKKLTKNSAGVDTEHTNDNYYTKNDSVPLGKKSKKHKKAYVSDTSLESTENITVDQKILFSSNGLINNDSEEKLIGNSASSENIIDNAIVEEEIAPLRKKSKKRKKGYVHDNSLESCENIPVNQKMLHNNGSANGNSKEKLTENSANIENTIDSAILEKEITPSGKKSKKKKRKVHVADEPTVSCPNSPVDSAETSVKNLTDMEGIPGYLNCNVIQKNEGSSMLSGRSKKLKSDCVKEKRKVSFSNEPSFFVFNTSGDSIEGNIIDSPDNIKTIQEPANDNCITENRTDVFSKTSKKQIKATDEPLFSFPKSPDNEKICISEDSLNFNCGESIIENSGKGADLDLKDDNYVSEKETESFGKKSKKLKKNCTKSKKQKLNCENNLVNQEMQRSNSDSLGIVLEEKKIEESTDMVAIAENADGNCCIENEKALFGKKSKKHKPKLDFNDESSVLCEKDQVDSNVLSSSEEKQIKKLAKNKVVIEHTDKNCGLENETVLFEKKSKKHRQSNEKLKKRKLDESSILSEVNTVDQKISSKKQKLNCIPDELSNLNENDLMHKKISCDTSPTKADCEENNLQNSNSREAVPEPTRNCKILQKDSTHSPMQTKVLNQDITKSTKQNPMYRKMLAKQFKKEAVPEFNDFMGSNFECVKGYGSSLKNKVLKV